MSESVSFKVIVVWLLFIFTFACLGIFGFLNQDLLKNKENEEVFVPNVNSENAIACSTELERGTLKYDFVLNTDNTIKNVRIAYTAKNGIQEDYDVAKSLQELKVLGIESTIQGGYNDFLFIMYINMTNTDISTLLNYKETYEKLGIVIENTNNYTEYNNILHTIHSSIKCEKISK